MRQADARADGSRKTPGEHRRILAVGDGPQAVQVESTGLDELCPVQRVGDQNKPADGHRHGRKDLYGDEPRQHERRDLPPLSLEAHQQANRGVVRLAQRDGLRHGRGTGSQG